MEATAPAASPRERWYTAIEPRCEWSHTEDCNILTVDVSGFKKEELKVLANTCGKLTVSGERQVDGAQWERFLKEFQIPRSSDTRRIQAKMDHEVALLYVILPKTSPPPQQHEQIKEPTNAADSPNSSGHSGSGKQDARKGSAGEKDESKDERASQDTNITQAASEDINRTGDTKVETKNARWWKKIRPLHVLGLVLALAIVGVGVCALYVMLM